MTISQVGAPANWVQCITDHNLEDSQAVMQSDEVKLILSTGEPGMVKASYSAGKPAIGVGSGNAPILVDETADVEQACGSIILGKTFDNGEHIIKISYFGVYSFVLNTASNTYQLFT